MNKTCIVTATRKDLGLLLHTALRKLCNSRVTSAAYNVIHLLVDHDRESWSVHLNAVWDELESRKPKTPEEVRDAVKIASTQRMGCVSAGTNALYCLFLMFSDEDFQGYVGFLYDPV
jgi:hypothetical protein